jgi:hypothetical protein
MDLPDFCKKLQELQLDHTHQALAILWFHDEKTPDAGMSAGQLTKLIYEMGMGNPHSTRLGKAIKNTGHVIQEKTGFRLKALARIKIRELLHPILGTPKPKADQDLGYIPKDVWKDTRGYIERVCEQLNGCYQFEYYDAAAVMLRRVVETLIIECYEYLGRLSEIKAADGNLLMLKDLIHRAKGANGLALGRNVQDSLSDAKVFGDLSAHNRRYNAVKGDLDKIQQGVRTVVDELIKIACINRVKK